jgi:hypothetical protein
MIKNKVMSISLVFLILIISVSFTINTNKVTLKSDNDVNKIGNIINGGYIAQQGASIYYSNGGYEPIRILKPNGDSKFICDYYGGSYINIVNNYIYYISVSEGNGNEIIKVKTDGTNERRVLKAKCSFLYVKDKWMYFTVMGTGNLYKAKTDGTNIKKLSDDFCTFTNVVGDTIYYCNVSDKRRIYKITNNKKSKLTNDSCSYINVVGDWIYFINETDSKKIYKIRINGNEETAIIAQKAEAVNVSDNWIYYAILDDDSIHKSKLDGTGKETLIANSTSSTPCLSILGGWIFYFSPADGYKICKVRLDGTGKTILQ